MNSRILAAFVSTTMLLIALVVAAPSSFAESPPNIGGCSIGDPDELVVEPVGFWPGLEGIRAHVKYLCPPGPAPAYSIAVTLFRVTQGGPPFQSLVAGRTEQFSAASPQANPDFDAYADEFCDFDTPTIYRADWEVSINGDIRRFSTLRTLPCFISGETGTGPEA